MVTTFITTDTYSYLDGNIPSSILETSDSKPASWPEQAAKGWDFSVCFTGHTDTLQLFHVQNIRDLAECRRWWKVAKAKGARAVTVAYNKL